MMLCYSTVGGEHLPVGPDNHPCLFIRPSSAFPFLIFFPSLRTLATVPIMSHSEIPFTLNVPDADLDILRKKLELARFPDELDGAQWDYGTPLADVKRFVDHWKNAFDWRAKEAEINKLPMFTRDIDIDGFGTLNIHYIHQKSQVSNAIPLLFVHGCQFFRPSVCPSPS